MILATAVAGSLSHSITQPDCVGHQGSGENCFEGEPAIALKQETLSLEQAEANYADYLSHLKTCSPHITTLPSLLVENATLTVSIEGWENERCRVEQNIKELDTGNESPFNTCYLSSETISIAQAIAYKIEAGRAHTVETEALATRFSEALAQECRQHYPPTQAPG